MSTTIVASPPSAAAISPIIAEACIRAIAGVPRRLRMVALPLVMPAEVANTAVLRVAAESLLTGMLRLWRWKAARLPTLLLWLPGHAVDRGTRSTGLSHGWTGSTNFARVVTTGLLPVVLLRHWLSLGAKTRMGPSKGVRHARVRVTASWLLSLGWLS